MTKQHWRDGPPCNFFNCFGFLHGALPPHNSHSIAAHHAIDRISLLLKLLETQWFVANM